MEKRFEYIKNSGENILVKCYCLDEKKIVVEDGVREIGPSVFRGSKAEEIILPDSVEEIYDKAFAYCTNLKHIRIGGNNLRNIGKRLFSECEHLQEVSFVSTLEEDMRPILSDLANCLIKSHDCYGMSDSETMNNVKEIFAKKYRKMTLKISAGEKSIVIPKNVDIGERALLKKYIFNALSDGYDRFASKEDKPFNKDVLGLENFLAMNISHPMCRFLTAMEFYFLEKSESALRYLKKYSSSICLMLATEKNDYLLTEFIKLGIMDEHKLEYALKKTIDNGLAISTAYILNLLDKKKKATLQN